MAIGDRLRSAVTLWGAPDCVNTAKCLMTAGEKGMSVKTAMFDPSSSEIQSMSPLGVGPVLRHVDFVVTGHTAIMSYMDDKGFGPSLVPRNGVLRATMYEWCVNAIIVLQPKMDDSGTVDKCVAALDKQLQSTNPSHRGSFICGDFTLADIHWAACANMLDIKGMGNVLERSSAVAEWWSKVKTHPSTSKEKLEPYTCMPTKADVDSNTLRDLDVK